MQGKIFRRMGWFMGLCVMCGFSAFIGLPDEILGKLGQQLTTYIETYTPQKVYLHLDKPAYMAGDEIWFKAYAVEASTHLPDSSSGVLYVELLTDKGKMLSFEKIRLLRGIGNGYLKLEENLPTSTYQLRAYTRWMQNGKPDFFYSRLISVTNANEKFSESPLATTALDVQFFPEGGNLVVGLESVVAFKAIDIQGKGVAVKGFITGSSTDTVCTFSSLHRGMGTFKLLPLAGQTYTAYIQKNDGSVVTVPLPKPLSQGWGLQVKVKEGSLAMTVHSTQPGDEVCYLMAQTRGKITYQKQVRLNQQTFSVQLSNRQFPAGITQITLFDATGEPQCERLVFVHPEPEVQLQITSDKLVYKPREKITLTLTARDTEGNPVAGNFSMAVTDAGNVVSAQETIHTSLLLTSDLKGTIEDPSFYFQEANSLATKALDCLMLTQGWHRFTWQEVRQSSLPAPVFSAEKAITLSVQLLDKQTRAPIPNHILMLAAPSEKSVFRYGYTDTQGKVALNALDFEEYRNIFVQIDSKDLFETAVVLADTLLRSPLAGSVPPFTFAAQQTPSMQEHPQIWSAIQRSYTTGQAGNTHVVNADTLHPVPPIYHKADERIVLDEFTLFPTMAEVLRDIVPWGMVTNKRGQATGFRILNLDTRMYFKRNPLYFIDNIPLTRIDPILNLDPASVASVECIRNGMGRGQFGELGFHGILCVFTKAGDFYPSREPGMYSFPVRGFQKTREFYVPQYTTSVASHRLPDFRSLLYWNPTIVTQADGTATVSFYNADNLTHWRVAVEGLSDSGIPCTGAFTYQVAFP